MFAQRNAAVNIHAIAGFVHFADCEAEAIVIS
jgi:hypothetical protein